MLPSREEMERYRQQGQIGSKPAFVEDLAGAMPQRQRPAPLSPEIMEKTKRAKAKRESPKEDVAKEGVAREGTLIGHIVNSFEDTETLSQALNELFQIQQRPDLQEKLKERAGSKRDTLSEPSPREEGGEKVFEGRPIWDYTLEELKQKGLWDILTREGTLIGKVLGRH